MHLQKKLRDKLNQGKQIKMNQAGVQVYASNAGNGIVSKDLIFTTFFYRGMVVNLGIHKSKFSKMHVAKIAKKLKSELT